MTSAMNLPTIDFNNLSELKSRMTAFTSRFDHFIAAGREQLRRERDEFAAGMAEDRLVQRADQQAIEATLREQQELERTLQTEKQEVQEMQASVAEFSDKKTTMIEYKDALEQQTSKLQEIMAKKREMMASKRQELALQNVKNKPELHAWETQLGLRIDSAGTDLLRFTFTHINAKEPSMAHSFVINLTTATYTVNECHPPLSSINDSLQRLNTTRDFSAFLKEVRKEFTALYR